jgi:hypothetical protein
MYPVSNAFLEAVKANTRKYYWTGRITTTAGTVYEFDQDDMVKGSGYITSQCCGSTEIELGTVYAAEMGISLFSEINRYTLEDAKVELFYHLQVAGGSYERIPMGIFEVSEANRKAKCLEIKAYDYMVRFEKAFTSLESIGNAYDFMVLCSTACEVTLVKVRISDLNIRRGPGTDYDRVQFIPIGVYTIMEVRSGKGSSAGWGRLKSGIGWISLDFVKRL